MVMVFVAVGRVADSISGSHVHGSHVLAGSASICGHSTGPAPAISKAGSVRVLERFVFDVRVGAGHQGPDSGDLFVHESGCVDRDETGIMFLS